MLKTIRFANVYIEFYLHSDEEGKGSILGAAREGGEGGEDTEMGPRDSVLGIQFHIQLCTYFIFATYSPG